MLKHILRSFQLTEKEIKVFQKVLEMGAQPASNIARLCEMPRNTTRSILDKLVNMGLIIKTNRANTQYYATEKKANIIRALKHKKEKTIDEIEHQITMIERYGDELTNTHQSKSRPKITFYEGTKGIEKTYEDTLTAQSGIKSWASFEGMHEALPEYFESYYQRRTKKKIFIQSIHPDGKLARERQKNDEKEMRESRLVDAKKYQWTPEIQVYDNKINISSWKEKLGIIIESQEVADTLSAIFDMAWDGVSKK